MKLTGWGREEHKRIDDVLVCGNCRGPRDRVGQKYCRPCHAAYMRLTRKRYSELTAAELVKANSRAYANVYQRRGKLVQQPCEVCGATPAEKHHEDYAKPLAVRWLCERCHTDLHKSVTGKKRAA